MLGLGLGPSSWADWEYLDADGNRHTFSDDLSSDEQKALEPLRQLLRSIHFQQSLLQRPDVFRRAPPDQQPVRQALWVEASRLESGFRVSKKLSEVEKELAAANRDVTRMRREISALDLEVRDGRENQIGATIPLNAQEMEAARARIADLRTQSRIRAQMADSLESLAQELKAMPKAIQTAQEKTRQARVTAAAKQAAACDAGYESLRH